MRLVVVLVVVAARRERLLHSFQHLFGAQHAPEAGAKRGKHVKRNERLRYLHELDTKKER